MTYDVYVCIEEFETINDYFGCGYGKPKKVNVGDKYYLIRKPIPTKKLYKLQKVSSNKCEEFLYLRKNSFFRYFMSENDKNRKR